MVTAFTPKHQTRLTSAVAKDEGADRGFGHAQTSETMALDRRVVAVLLRLLVPRPRGPVGRVDRAG